MRSIKHIIVLLLIAGCASTPEKFTEYGEKLSPDSATSMADFMSNVSQEESAFKVRGVVDEVCQMKGCWMTLKTESGSTVRVRFKDYGFFVPKDISGKEVIVEGVANKELLDEETAKHYAEDGGKQYDESMRDAITFIAKGVLVRAE